MSHQERFQPFLGYSFLGQTAYFEKEFFQSFFSILSFNCFLHIFKSSFFVQNLLKIFSFKKHVVQLFEEGAGG
jgi:hypothetical protein